MEWNRSEALLILGDSVNLLRLSVRRLSELMSVLDENRGGLDEAVLELKAHVEQLVEHGEVGGSRREGKMTRSQAGTLIRLLTTLTHVHDTPRLIKTLSDLGTQTKVMMELMDRYDQVYGGELAGKDESVLGLLTDEELSELMRRSSDDKTRASYER